ncbi:MAG: hypothetical protein Fur0014_19400 [Rubrivivax sp.]
MRCSRPVLAALIAGLFVTTWSLPAAAQWKWRDANGRITVSDLPPPRDIPAKDILARPEPAVLRPAPAAASAASAPAVAPRPPVDRELQARKQAAEQEKAARLKAEHERLDAQRAENCRRARSHLAALDSGQRIARYNEKGEREVLDDKGRAEETRRAREVIASDCR